MVASSLREEVSLGFRRVDRRISLGADLFLSTSLNSLTWMIGRRGSSGPSYSHD